MQFENNANEKLETESQVNQDQAIACCSERVHIAYRGLADDRLYIAYDRTWLEVRYYKQRGLRVFCASCRYRVY